MTFKKLALASAIAVVPVAGFSVELLDEETLSGVTGQDGIELVIQTAAPISADIYLHDKDGLGTASSHSWAGAIVIDDFSFAGTVNIEIDAGDSSQAGTAPTLNVNVSIPTSTIITGSISVANSQRDDAAPGWGVNTTTGVILNTMTIAMSGLTMNIQLGNEPQGNMIAISSTVTGGVSIDSFRLNDAGGALSGGGIGASNISLMDAGGGPNLGLAINANATNSGLVLGMTTVGVGGMDVRIADAYLGSTTAGIVGDVTVVGLNLGGSTITISGK